MVDVQERGQVLHTCHRLREVALAHPTIEASGEMRRLPLMCQTAQWSKRVPLDVVGSHVKIFKELAPETRFRSINLYEIDGDNFCRLQVLRMLCENGQLVQPGLYGLLVLIHIPVLHMLRLRYVVVVLVVVVHGNIVRHVLLVESVVVSRLLGVAVRVVL